MQEHFDYAERDWAGIISAGETRDLVGRQFVRVHALHALEAAEKIFTIVRVIKRFGVAVVEGKLEYLCDRL